MKKKPRSLIKKFVLYLFTALFFITTIIMILPSSHSPSVKVPFQGIKPSQAMRAALADRQLGWNSRGVSSLLTVWRLPCVKRICILGCRGQIEMLLS